MKNYETIRKLYGLKECLEWLCKNARIKNKKANLWGADLRGIDLSYTNLSMTDLRGSDLKMANLSRANLRGANLRGIDLRGSDLRGANFDFSGFPLWCGSLGMTVDDRLVNQLVYHVLRLEGDGKNLKELKSMKSLVKIANQFHRADECGVIK